MALPKQVQAQLVEIEALEKSLAAQFQPDGDDPHDGDNQEQDTEAAETEAKAAPEKPAKAKPTDVAPTDVEEETFAQKYKTLQGKYDAEVPRLHQQIRDLNSQMSALQEAATRPSEAPKPKERVSLVTDADRAEFGEELIDVQRRVAQEVSQEYEDRLERQDAVIRALQEKIAATGNQVGEMSFSQRLNSLVPDFAQIDADERWMAWLNEYDPMLRGPRRLPAKAAFDAGDAEAVAHYVALFKESIATPGEAPKTARRAELEKQVTPNRSANSVKSQSAGRDAKVYSAREVEAAWGKVRSLNTRGKYDDAATLEAEITAAYLEGRVRH